MPRQSKSRPRPRAVLPTTLAMAFGACFTTSVPSAGAADESRNVPRTSSGAVSSVNDPAVPAGTGKQASTTNEAMAVALRTLGGIPSVLTEYAWNPRHRAAVAHRLLARRRPASDLLARLLLRTPYTTLAAESPTAPEAPEAHPVRPSAPYRFMIPPKTAARTPLPYQGPELGYVDKDAPAYARFRTWVNNAVNGSPGYDFHDADAALMFRLTRLPAYCTLAVSRAELQVAQAESAMASGARPAVASDSYLEVGPMIADLAATFETCPHFITTSQKARWKAYADQAVWNIWNYQSARWGAYNHPWSGWSVNNPGNNYYFSFLQATMSWALASRNIAWTAFLRDIKLPALQAYYAANPGGGSREGTGYGTAQKNLFEVYRLWRDRTGVDLANANTHATNTIAYWVHATVPTRDRFAPIGDQSRNSVPELYDYHRHLLLAARNLAVSPTARSMASWWLNNISVTRMAQGANFRHDLLPAGSGGAPPAELHYAPQGTGHLFARTDWGPGAMWLAHVAGRFDESHAHQDQGSFTLFAGDWLAVTENIWSHSGIQQGTDVHNVVRFERANPSASQCASPSGDRIVHQCEPSTSTMTVTPGASGALSILSNLTPAYGGNPALTSWTRRLDFANRVLTVRDNFSLGTGTTAFFQLNVPVQPVVNGLVATAGKLRMRVLEPASATLSVRNWNAINAGEFTRGWRIDVAGGTTTYLVELSEVP